VALASATALHALFQRACPEVVGVLGQALLGTAQGTVAALDAVYPFLAVSDFFRDVLAAAPGAVTAACLDAEPHATRA
jgi:hypothetical protein